MARKPGTRDVPNTQRLANSPRQADTSAIDAMSDRVDKLTAYKAEITRLPYSHNEQRRFAVEVLPLLIDAVVELTSAKEAAAPEKTDES